MEHCSGLGITLAFVYERVAPNLRRRDTAEVLWLSWHGTARERRAADKELVKRNGGFGEAVHEPLAEPRP